MGYLNNLSWQIHATAKEKGWWDKPRELPELIALCHSELSEALEDFRDDKDSLLMVGNKPEGWGVELIDCIIRVLDTCAYFDLDVDNIMSKKVDYNTTRPYRHGGKLA